MVGRLMGPEQATEFSFDVLLIDDICSFLTPRLVTRVKQSGSEVIGVFAPPDGSDAKRRLLECGISDVIEADATPTEFVDTAVSALAHRVAVPLEHPPGAHTRTVGVVGTTDGVGATEVAIGLAQTIPEPAAVSLVDLDPVWPSVAQRLDLPVHPNIRSALDATLHSGDLVSATHPVGRLRVIGGVADHGAASQIAQAEASALFEELGSLSDVVVVDMGAFDRAIRGSIGRLDSVMLVGTGDPVGVTRLLRGIERLLDSADPRTAVAVVNMTPAKRFHGSEIRREIQEVFPHTPVVLLPFDRRVAEAAWEGERLSKGRFHKAVARMARLVGEGSSE